MPNKIVNYPFTIIPNIAFDPEVFEDREFFRFFCFACFKAPRMSRRQPFYSNHIELEPLEFIFGRKKWAKWLGIKESQAQKFLQRLKDSKYITKINSKSNRKMTIYKWVWEHFGNLENRQKQQQIDSKITAHQHSIKNNKKEQMKALLREHLMGNQYENE